MNFRYGLLGFLSTQPLTGYDLHKIFPKAVRPTQAYIYRVLTSMVKDGFVISTSVVEEKKPLRNVFSITAKGLAELDNWLSVPLPYTFPRPSVFAQMWFGSRCGKDQLIADMEGYRDKIKTFLEDALKFPPAEIPGLAKRLKKKQYDRYKALAYRSVIRYLQKEIEFCDSIVAELREIDNDMPESRRNNR